MNTEFSKKRYLCLVEGKLALTSTVASTILVSKEPAAAALCIFLHFFWKLSLSCQNCNNCEQTKFYQILPKKSHLMTILVSHVKSHFAPFNWVWIFPKYQIQDWHLGSTQALEQTSSWRDWNGIGIRNYFWYSLNLVLVRSVSICQSQKDKIGVAAGSIWNCLFPPNWCQQSFSQLNRIQSRGMKPNALLVKLFFVVQKPILLYE